jgi:hypothetical protein
LTPSLRRRLEGKTRITLRTEEVLALLDAAPAVTAE